MFILPYYCDSYIDSFISGDPLPYSLQVKGCRKTGEAVPGYEQQRGREGGREGEAEGEEYECDEKGSQGELMTGREDNRDERKY